MFSKNSNTDYASKFAVQIFLLLIIGSNREIFAPTTKFNFLVAQRIGLIQSYYPNTKKIEDQLPCFWTYKTKPFSAKIPSISITTDHHTNNQLEKLLTTRDRLINDKPNSYPTELTPLPLINKMRKSRGFLSKFFFIYTQA